LFHGFCSSKKPQTTPPKDAEAGPYCFLQINAEYLLKNNKDINKHTNIHIPQPQSPGQNAGEKSHVPLQLLLLQA